MDIDVSAIACPVVVLHNSEDAIREPTEARHTAELCRGGAAIASGLGHFSIVKKSSRRSSSCSRPTLGCRCEAYVCTVELPQATHNGTALPPVGLIMCRIRGRRMQGSFNHGTLHYRCRFPAEYALIEDMNYPKTVYVREEPTIDELDRWLAQTFAPKNLDATCKALVASQEIDEGGHARAAAARRKLADCDERLERYRATLEVGGDPAVIASWIGETQGERLAAERELARCAPPARLAKADVKAVAKNVREAVRALGGAPETSKLSSTPSSASASSTGSWLSKYLCLPRVRQSVSEGGLEPPRPCGH